MGAIRNVSSPSNQAFVCYTGVNLPCAEMQCRFSVCEEGCLVAEQVGLLHQERLETILIVELDHASQSTPEIHLPLLSERGHNTGGPAADGDGCRRGRRGRKTTPISEPLQHAVSHQQASTSALVKTVEYIVSATQISGRKLYQTSLGRLWPLHDIPACSQYLLKPRHDTASDIVEFPREPRRILHNSAKRNPTTQKPSQLPSNR